MHLKLSVFGKQLFKAINLQVSWNDIKTTAFTALLTGGTSTTIMYVEITIGNQEQIFLERFSVKVYCFPFSLHEKLSLITITNKLLMFL